ncbi:fibronectin type III domain-containing protein [Flectobacillus major]|uniref:fibronectin type III domain-containing protein n=1 Tax=Flectobacillus major TaxID=103 RepID=UPI000426BAC5|nr:fibronectin type III domain-containing protein [Flectobacillus major]
MKKYIFSGILIFSSVVVFGQNRHQTNTSSSKTLDKPLKVVPAPSKPTKASEGLYIVAKHQKNSISLRWAPLTQAIWQLGKQYGYILEKSTIKRDGKLLTTPEVNQPILLEPIDQMEWHKRYPQDDYVKATEPIYFETQEERMETDTAVVSGTLKGKYAFSVICADLSPNVATLMRLGYHDSSVKNNEEYLYRVRVNHPSYQTLKAYNQLTAGLQLNIPQYAPEHLSDVDFADSTVTLHWDESTYNIYSGYIIERSDDNGSTFTRVNKAPFVPVENTLQASGIVYACKVPILHKNYRFRVRGLDPFAEPSKPSNTVQVYAYQTQLVGAQNLKASFPAKNTVAINWEYPDSLQRNLKGFMVYKTKNLSDLTKVTPSPLGYNTHIMLDKVADGDENLYYIVSAVDLRGKETQSEPLFVSIIDSIPPKKVTKLHGKIDKKGVVKIGWCTSGERDLFGYNVFRAEGDTPNQTFLVKVITSPDTNLIDTIALHASSRKVRYIIVPLDYHSNIARQHDTLVLIRPDITPPYPPKINYLSLGDTSVTVKWSASISEDVSVYQLYKQLLPDTAKLLVKIYRTTDTLSFEDTQVEEQKPIRYTIRAVDSEGLVSNDSCALNVTVPRPHRLAGVDNVRILYDAKNIRAHLTWQYSNRRAIKAFYVYRQKDQGDLVKISTLSGQIFEFWDENLQPGLYTYRLMAHSTDNIISIKGKAITLKVK